MYFTIYKLIDFLSKKKEQGITVLGFLTLIGLLLYQGILIGNKLLLCFHHPQIGFEPTMYSVHFAQVIRLNVVSIPLNNAYGSTHKRERI